jgi:hypothetical protein
MAYLGPPPSQKLATPTSQYFSGNGSATAFTLNRPVNVAEDLNVFVNNVAQQPGSGKSYTATGTTLTFDAAPDAGTNNVYVVYRGLAEPTTRLEHPSGQPLAATTGTFSGAVSGTTGTFSGNVGVGTASDTGENHLQFTNNAVTAFVGVEGSSGNRFLGSATNNAFFGTTGADGLELATNNNVRMTIDSSGRVTMPSQPSFGAAGASASYIQTTPIPFPTVLHNIGNHYNSSTYTFTAPVAGRYLFHVHIGVTNGSANSTAYPTLAINGTGIQYTYSQVATTWYANNHVTSILNLAAADYVKVSFSGSGTYYNGGSECRFFGHLIG